MNEPKLPEIATTADIMYSEEPQTFTRVKDLADRQSGEFVQWLMKNSKGTNLLQEFMDLPQTKWVKADDVAEYLQEYVNRSDLHNMILIQELIKHLRGGEKK